MTTTDQQALTYWQSLPPLQITMHEALALFEYSATNPTGVTVGKRWRRENGSFDHEFKRRGGHPRWVICEYQEAPPQKQRVSTGKGDGSWEYKMVEMCEIITYRPVIRVKMGSK
jgi:hypothetical protein